MFKYQAIVTLTTIVISENVQVAVAVKMQGIDVIVITKLLDTENISYHAQVVYSKTKCVLI